MISVFFNLCTLNAAQMKKEHIYFLLICLILSCSEKPTTAMPEGILSEKKMISVLTDIQLIEGAVSKKLIDRSVNNKESHRYYTKAFEKQGITRQQFDESINFYTENPENMEKIYEKVLVELSKIKAELQNAKKRTVEETK